MEFNSIHSHQDDTPRMHYTHGTESEGKMKRERNFEKKNSKKKNQKKIKKKIQKKNSKKKLKKKIQIILSLTEEENFKVKIEKKIEIEKQNQTNSEHK